MFPETRGTAAADKDAHDCLRPPPRSQADTSPRAEYTQQHDYAYLEGPLGCLWGAETVVQCRDEHLFLNRAISWLVGDLLRCCHFHDGKDSRDIR